MTPAQADILALLAAEAFRRAARLAGDARQVITVEPTDDNEAPASAGREAA